MTSHIYANGLGLIQVRAIHLLFWYMYMLWAFNNIIIIIIIITIVIVSIIRIDAGVIQDTNNTKYLFWL